MDKLDYTLRMDQLRRNLKKVHQYFCLFLVATCFSKALHSQSHLKESYRRALDSLEAMLMNRATPSFKKAVFINENAFYADSLKYGNFESDILALTGLAKEWLKANRVNNYRYADSLNLNANFALLNLIKDTVKLSVGGRIYGTTPYNYDFEDFLGQKKWQNMFVTKLLHSHKGNCHSLTYLYKILADELGATCWLSLAPNHIYIKNRSKSFGWYNTELSNGSFPIDAWLMASGYISLQSVQNGIYMDTLSNSQSIALCVFDLAKGYENRTKNYTDGFIIKCCDVVLRYFSRNTQALLLKAETLKYVYEKIKTTNKLEADKILEKMQALYVGLLDLGYREMPTAMYFKWLQSMNKAKEKYRNKNIPLQL